MTPSELVGFGRSVELRGRDVTVTPAAGPDLALRWGTLALADPGWPENLPVHQVSSIGQGTSATTSSTVALPVAGSPEPVPTTLAVAIGRLHEVTSWQRLIGYDTHVHLETRSGLGAFYDITDTEALRPLVDDARYLQEVRDRAAAEGLVAMEADGKAVAVVFSCPGGPGSYPAYHGFEVGMGAVAVLVDLQVRDGARPGPRP